LPLIKKQSGSIHLTQSVRFVIRGYRIEISAEDDATHSSRDTNLFIGLGDRNRYTGRFGAGIGYASVLIDCGNQSYYDVPDMSIGAGVLGVGLAYTAGVGDVFRGGSACFGAGLAGVGALSHEGGESSFRASALSEGFGSFGEGLLVDSGDRNSFHGELFTQGAARTQGVGWLVEQGANDTFVAGGYSVIESKNAAISSSQGYAAGFGSEDVLLSGGLGLVTTTGTGQSYVGGIRCQGAAMWGGVGSIMDKGARSSHSAAQEAHGYANHQAAAFVYNYGGFGSYTARFGTCESCAADSSVAMILDRAGHDLYSSKEGRPASAMKNSVALFLNSGPESSFVEPGAGSPGGETGIGLFCDVGAGSSFSAGASFAPIQVSDGLSVFFQDGQGFEVAASSSERKQGFAPQAGAAVELEWARARAGDDSAFRGLVAMGAPAAEFAFKTSLTDPGATAVMARLVAQIGDDARKILALDIVSNDLGRAQAALRIACLSPGGGLSQAIVQALGRPSLQRLAAKAAGLCQVHGAVSLLQPLCVSQDSLLAFAAMTSLGQIGDHSCTGTAAALLTSPEWPLRHAAIGLLAKFPSDAIAAASGLMASSNEQGRRTGVQVIAALNSPEGFRRLGHLLDDPSPAVQLEVLIALQGHVPDELKGKVADLQRSGDLFVRKVAEGMRVDG
jgi:hypothetical protein